MSLDINPARLREMANDVRRNADAIEAITPIVSEQRANARRYMDSSDLAVKLEESLEALDLVTKYHATMVRNFCTDTDYIATVQEELDKAIGAAISEAGGQR
ncbi:hypothetical protein [Nocardia rhizosphaerihabitans]|uniref:PE domain-containing protein n=1 Tax=Nocardia rhizosphaerihabitans TaxID=1691570 RepID=A0ABQ2KVU8_9NOCA|nr:hypothetical protein [Nocardia rhizosphaerihabitans]GGN94296.1 hypothetical protein GCM10011610_57090 [Nocardia rhizosphaerihabitans]